jgi:hypothetical protein
MATKWQGEPKCWRVRGKSNDGTMVTLGRHDTEEAAQTDADKLVKQGFYHNVTLERIEPAAEPPLQDSAGV